MVLFESPFGCMQYCSFCRVAAVIGHEEWVLCFRAEIVLLACLVQDPQAAVMRARHCMGCSWAGKMEQFASRVEVEQSWPSRRLHKYIWHFVCDRSLSAAQSNCNRFTRAQPAPPASRFRNRRFSPPRFHLL